MLLGGRGQRTRHGVHAALGEVHAGDGVHVGDHRVDRQRPGGGQARVHRLEREQPPQPLVGEEARDLGAEPAEAPQRHQPGQRCADQLQRRVQVAVDEVRQLGAVQLAQEGHEAAVAVRVARAAHGRDLGRHVLDVGADVDARAVGEAGPVGRVQPVQGEPVGQLLADGVQRRGEQLRHGQHRRSGVEGVAAVADQPAPPAGDRLALQHGHLAARTGQVQRRREAAQARADDHHGVGPAGNGTHGPARYLCGPL